MFLKNIMPVSVKLIMYSNKYPIVRGIGAYILLWPTSNIIQQTFSGKRWKDYDWREALKYSLYGGLYVAPTLYCWIRLSTIMWPKVNIKTAVSKALTEQISYGPFACASFFYIMSLLEFKTPNEAIREVKDKFFPTYKIGLCVWPILQTINFLLISEKNRVPFTSICSLLWTSFLAYMKHLE